MDSSIEEADGTINRCAHCMEPSTDHCNGCHKAPDVEGGHTETVWYCSPKCQKADWKFHKFDCRKAQARKSLYRVAETAKLAFFRLVERIFDLHVVGVEDQGDTLYVREGPGDRSIFNFPAEHLNSDQDKQATMAWMNCGGSEEYVQVLFETMMQGQKALTIVYRRSRSGGLRWHRNSDTIRLRFYRCPIQGRGGSDSESQILASVSAFRSNGRV